MPIPLESLSMYRRSTGVSDTENTEVEDIISIIKSGIIVCLLLLIICAPVAWIYGSKAVLS